MHAAFKRGVKLKEKVKEQIKTKSSYRKAPEGRKADLQQKPKKKRKAVKRNEEQLSKPKDFVASTNPPRHELLKRWRDRKAATREEVQASVAHRRNKIRKIEVEEVRSTGIRDTSRKDFVDKLKSEAIEQARRAKTEESVSRDQMQQLKYLENSKTSMGGKDNQGVHDLPPRSHREAPRQQKVTLTASTFSVSLATKISLMSFPAD